MPNRGLGGQSQKGATQVLRYARMVVGEAFDVGLVDDGLVPGRARVGVALPVERAVDDDCLGYAPGVVTRIELVVREAVAE